MIASLLHIKYFAIKSRGFKSSCEILVYITEIQQSNLIQNDDAKKEKP